MFMCISQLLNLLKIVIQKQRSKSHVCESHMRFDPKAALFVCNRFDLVDRNELEKVKQNALGNFLNVFLYLFKSFIGQTMQTAVGSVH